MNDDLLKYSIKSYLQNEDSIKKEMNKKRDRIKFYKKYDEKQILNFNNEDVYCYLKELYSMNAFYNKKYLIDKVLSANGIEKIRNYLVRIYNCNSSISFFDELNTKIKYLGPSTISELLCYYNEDKFIIWNGCTSKVFKYLGENDIPNITSKLTYLQYNKLIQNSKIIQKEINANTMIQHKLIDIDIFFRYIYHNILGLY